MGETPLRPDPGASVIVAARMAVQGTGGVAIANASFVTLCHPTSGDAAVTPLFKIVPYRNFKTAAKKPFEEADDYAKNIVSLVCINFGALKTSQPTRGMK
jgi:hypothetical protein